MKNTDHDIDFENSIGPWLGRTIKILDFNLHEQFRMNGLDLTKEQMVVLKKLSQKDGLNQNELAFLTLRNKSSLTRLVCKMEKKGLITRKTCTEDKRNKHLFITTLGEETFHKSKPVIKSMLATMQKGITEDEKKTMIRLLKQIQENFNENITSF